jgi:hypothetical protein
LLNHVIFQIARAHIIETRLKTLITTSGGSRVDASLGVGDDFADNASVLEIGEGFTGERTIDFQTVDEHGHGDESV